MGEAAVLGRAHRDHESEREDLADPARHAHRGERLCRPQAVEVSRRLNRSVAKQRQPLLLKPAGSVCRSTFTVITNDCLYDAAAACDGVRRMACCSGRIPIG
jgi:hypothetical protein